jgi:16S rRNA (cytidine1402-2'-O)-methyltransferase
MTGTLFVVPNLLGIVPPESVLPVRTIETARGLTHWAVETPKAARAFLGTLALPRPIATLDIREIGDATSQDQLQALLAPAVQGENTGLLSDAGCPGVADPGAGLVAAAHAAGVRVVPLVGPSAVLLALMASGMNGQSFAFHGYLPVKPEAREKALRTLDDAVVRTGQTQIFIETPYRNDAMAKAILQHCRPTTQFCVGVDLTLSSEAIVSRPVSAWRKARPISLDKRPALFLLGRV